MTKRLIVGLLAALMVSLQPSPGAAASLSEIILGIGVDMTPNGGRILQPAISVTNLDWPVYVLVRVTAVSPGTTVSTERIGPDSTSLWMTSVRWTSNINLGWASFFIPIPGTPNEDRIGQWRILVRLGEQTREATLTVSTADRSALATLQANAQANANSFTANYRLGVGASLFGEDATAIASLTKAASLARTSIYPRLALCRHYFKRNMNAEALQECSFAKGLLMGVEDQSLAGLLQRSIEEILAKL